MYGDLDPKPHSFGINPGLLCGAECLNALPSESEDVNYKHGLDEASKNQLADKIFPNSDPTETLLGECTRWGAFNDSPYGWPAVHLPPGEDPFCGVSPLSPGWQERVIRESRTLMQNYSTSAEILEIVSSDTTSKLSPEEENAICAVVPKLVRVSISGPVRGVYLDKGRALWRANWREGGRVRTKGFRIAKWGTYEARRKAIEVRKLMETRACFLRLKAVAYGFARSVKRSSAQEAKQWVDSVDSEASSSVKPRKKKETKRTKRLRRS